MAAEAQSLKVFVSYSRGDVDFADQLVLALEDKGFEAILDRHDISGAENWRERLGKLILSADAVAFVLTEKSITSEVCAWEVEEATRLGKRIIPLTPASIAEVAPPEALQELNWIPFYRDEAIPGSGFYYGVKRLNEALKVDFAWLRAQTRYSERAAEWARTKPDDLLLRGNALREAQIWLAKAPLGTSPPGSVREYLSASADAEQLREAAARVQVEEREGALKTAETAIAERQAAIAAKVKTDLRLRWLASAALIAGVALATLALGGLWYAGSKAAEAGDLRATLFAQAVNELTDVGDRTTALLMAVAGDPAARQGVLEPIFRPDGYASLRTSLARAYSGDRLVTTNFTGSEITELAGFPDGKRFITFHADKSARIWEAGVAEPVTTLALPDVVEKAIVFPDGDRMLINWGSAAPEIWRISANAKVRDFDESSLSHANAIAVRSDGQFVLLGGGGRVELWGAAGSMPTSVFEDDQGRYVTSLAFGSEGSAFAAGYENGLVRIWDGQSEEPPKTVSADTASIQTLSFIPGEDGVIAGSNSGRVVVVESSDSMESMQGFSVELGADPVGVSAIEFSEEAGYALLISSDGQAKLINNETAAVLDLFDGRSGNDDGVLLPAAGAVAIASRSGLVNVWRIQADGQEHPPVVTTSGERFQAARVAEASGVIAGRELKGQVAAWRAGEAATLASWSGPETGIVSAISPDGQLVVAEFESEMALLRVGEDEPIQKIPLGDDPVRLVEFSRDGRRFAFARSSGDVQLWEVGRAEPVGVAKVAAEVSSIALHPAGDRIFVGVKDAGQVWRVGATEPSEVFPIPGNVTAATFHADGQRLVMGTSAGRLQIWRLGRSGAEQSFETQSNGILAIAFHPDGRHFATALGDGAAKIWQVGQNREVQRFLTLGADFGDIAFLPNGKTLLATSGLYGSGAALIWELNPVVLANASAQARMACERLKELKVEGFSPLAREEFPILQGQPSDPCVAAGVPLAPAADKAPPPPPAPVSDATVVAGPEQ